MLGAGRISADFDDADDIDAVAGRAPRYLKRQIARTEHQHAECFNVAVRFEEVKRATPVGVAHGLL